METKLIDELRQLMSNPDTEIYREWLDEMRLKYPYFTMPSLLFLKQAKKADVTDYDQLLAQLAITTPDRRMLCDQLGDNDVKFSSFYPPEEKPVALDTESTLDTFLQQYGSQDEKETEILNQLIFNPTPDYSQVLAVEEAKSTPREDVHQPMSENDRRIDLFISQAKEKKAPIIPEKDDAPIAHVVQQSEEKIQQPEDKDETMLSESLAKIYIKQGKYSKALQIIKTISLKFPEKSIYFADQIRFLQKLILTEKIINKK